MKQFASFAILLLVFLVAGILNPGISEHREAIQAAEGNDSVWNLLDFSHMLKAASVEYHNYILFSTCTIGEVRVSTGYFGHVAVNSVNWMEILGLSGE